MGDTTENREKLLRVLREKDKRPVMYNVVILSKYDNNIIQSNANSSSDFQIVEENTEIKGIPDKMVRFFVKTLENHCFQNTKLTQIYACHNFFFA